MNVGDGSPVIKEAGALNKASVSMVGNPPQTLPPELRGDGPLIQQTTTATAMDCKASDFSSEGSNLINRPEVPPCSQHEGALLLSPASVSIASLRKSVEVPTPAMDGSPIFPTQQWTCSKKPPPNSSHGGVTPSKRTNSQAQSVISLPAGFQCSSLFKPGQPVAFLPSTTFSPPLCKISLPPGLGQIAALREATASQLHVECRPQASSSGVAPNLQTYSYPFSVAKAPAPEARPPSTAAHKNKHGPVSGSKNSKAGVEHGSPLLSVASPIVPRPLKQPTLSPAPPPPVSVSPPTPPAIVSSHSRLLNHLEKSPSHQGVDKTSIMYARLKSQCVVVQEHTVTEERDVPLDLSSKSKRPKVAREPQDPSPASECHLTEDGQGGDPIPSKRLAPATFGPGSPLPIFPEALRNGTPPKQASRLLNHQAHKPSMAWAKSPHGTTSNLVGTYVGVASPILASTLRSKDGKGAAFVEDLQSTAKQVTISIIDQGEQLVSRVMKGPSVVRDTQHTLGSKYTDSACLPRTQVCTPKDSCPTVLSVSAGSNPHCKLSGGRTMVPLSPTVENPARHQPVFLPHQGSTVKQKTIQVTPKLRVTTGCKGPLFQSTHPSPSKMIEKKWGKTKSPLSNLESIVKQKALETSVLGGEGCCKAASAGPRRPEARPEAVSLHLRPQDASSGGFPPFRPMKRREGKVKMDSSEGLPAKISSKQENGSIAEPREKNTEKNIGQEENVGSEECSDNSKLVAQGQVLGSSGPVDKNGVKTKSQKDEEKPESLSVKLEEMALSIVKGQSADVAEQGKELNVTRETPPSKGEVTVNKHKKISRNKLDKSSLVTSKKMVRCLKRSREKEGGTSEWPHRRKKKQGAPVLESGQLDMATSQLSEEREKAGSGWSNLADVTRPPHVKAGNEGSSVADAPGLQGSPGWLNKEAGSVANCPPKAKRGRRPTEKKLSAAKDPPPAPQTQVRRKRGRPRSNPLPDQACLGKTKPVPAGVEGDPSQRKKRKRRRNRKYQNGEYVIERDQTGEGDGKCVATRQATRAGTDQRVGLYPRLSATLACQGASPDRTPRRALQTRSGSTRQSERPASPEPKDKPSGKRKFKSKHLCDTEEKKVKTKRGSSGKRSAPLISDGDGTPVKKPLDLPTPPRGLPSPPTSRRGSAGRGRTPESPPGRPAPPEVRRLIVNKNAGETLLQRAARLGYQEVVLYCLEKDEREVNRRDNAGYTALHEACSRGWTQIVQVLLEHGADVNCSAQDGTRPIHDAVASDNLPAVWMLLNRGADPTLATYSGQTAVKLAQSNGMKAFLSEYFADLDERADQDSSVHWDFYSSSVFEAGQEACWNFLLSFPEEEEKEASAEEDCFMFEFSSELLLPCYYVQVSLSQGFCNWFLLPDVLRRLKMSARIFRARYPHLEVVSVSWAELCRQVSVSQVTLALEDSQADEDEEAGGQVELVRCVSELQELLGSSVHFLEAETSDTPGSLGRQSSPAAQICLKADSNSQPSKSKKSNKKDER